MLKKNKPDKRTNLEKKWHHGEYHTYDGWNCLGYYIIKGEKARTVKGRKVFSRDQVEKKRIKDDYARLKGVAKTQHGKGFSAGLVDWDYLDEDGEGGPFF